MEIKSILANQICAVGIKPTRDGGLDFTVKGSTKGAIKGAITGAGIGAKGGTSLSKKENTPPMRP